MKVEEKIHQEWVRLSDKRPPNKCGLLIKLIADNYMDDDTKDHIFYGFLWESGKVHIVMDITDNISMSWKASKEFYDHQIYWLNRIEDEAQEYHTLGKVGFYGQYIKIAEGEDESRREDS